MAQYYVACDLDVEFEGKLYKKGDMLEPTNPIEEMFVERLIQRGALGGSMGGFDPPGGEAPVDPPVDPPPEEGGIVTPHDTPPMTTADLENSGRRVRR